MNTLARPSLDQVMMKIAFDIAERGTCRRRKVGAVAVDLHGRGLPLAGPTGGASR